MRTSNTRKVRVGCGCIGLYSRDPGLKAAEQILRKHPSHGDTQAMKALILNSQDQKDEAFALAKEALRNGMKSHITWHVYGLLYRSIKNWEEAARAYKMALRLEPDSIQIQRDLGLLQMQVRDYEGYAQSRRNILQGRSMVRQNWTALAIAQHLGGDLESAERTLNTYEETLKQQPPKTDIEHSEAVLYKITIIAEMAQTERALEHLDAVLNRLGDRTAALEMRARFLSDLGRREEAEAAYRVLLERNADYRMYYDGLMKAVDPEGTDIQKRKEICDEYVRRNPRGDAARRIPLDFLEGDAFREAADSYLQHMLKKGVPSTFANVKALYRDPSKMKTIIDLVEGYTKVVENEPEANGVKEESHDDDSNLTNGVEEKPSSSKSSTFRSSIHYFLIQHYNYVSSRDLTKAMHLVDKEIEAKPDSVDLHMSKARVYKHLGNIQKASETMELARTKDTRDRYINTKAAKYLLRNDQNDVAKDILSKFTKNDAIGGTIGDLIDLQCMWFLLEDGESHFRQGQLGLALKRFTSVYDVFEIWQEDQFDFHNFSLRKGQIRAYVDMIRWEDHLRDHPFFSRGARGAIRAYLRLHDHPELAHGPQTNGMNGELSKADKKKAQKKAAKAAQKAEQEEAEKQDAKKTNQTTADGEVKKVDTDPNGMKLVQTEKPLEDAMKFLNLLLDFSPKNIDSHLLGFEVFMRRSEYIDLQSVFFQRLTLHREISARITLLTRFPRPRAYTCRSTFPDHPIRKDNVGSFDRH